jgi:DNA polymerase-3 subunit gamma/tau
MYQVIARKYRPQTFAELVGQEHVRTTLENAIAQRRIAHGYILAGQRGTGKTTVARIVARCLNCEQGPTASPCGTCPSCVEIAAGSSMDVIEIDAASNRGINEMRELRENVRFLPARDRFKVFIIDEAHQITSEAFNALLKTLEEPPEWVVFLLCTTEAHKIPTTISSRCQQFSFRSVEFPLLVERMRWIAAQEGVEAGEEALSVLAQAGEGSVRDSLSAMDQAIACCGNKLEAAPLRELLGLFSLDSLNQVARALLDQDPQRMLEIVAELESNGRSLQHFSRELARYFRNLLVVKISGAPTRLVAASPAEQQRLAEVAAGFSEEDLTRHLKLSLDLFRDLQQSLQPRLHLEMGLLRLVHAGRLAPIEEALASVSGSGGGSAKAPPARSGPAPVRISQAAPAAAATQPQTGDLRSRLHAALIEANQTHLADAVEHAQVTESAGEVVFTAPKLYQLLLKDAKLEAAVRQAAGRPLRVSVKVGEAGAAPASNGSPPPTGDVTERALNHPEVKRFQELFPGSTVRAVRNLKESES